MSPKSIWSAIFFLALAWGSLAFARVEFELRPITAAEFRGFDKLSRSCGEGAASFWCSRLDAELTLITTKSNDYVFGEAGELVAVFTKQQKGQNNMGRDGVYRISLDSNDNLIPVNAELPGGAVLLDGEYAEPEAVEGDWQRQENGAGAHYRGTFRYEVDGVMVEKRLTVSSVAHVLAAEVVATRQAEGAGETAVAYAYPGIARTEQPVLKVGQGESFSLNPIAQPVDAPRYISLQNNNRNTGNALVLVPDGTAGVAALPLPPSRIALQAVLPPEAEAEARIGADVYAGPNELVRYEQEGLLDLPGLFRPNILGSFSLGVLWVLQQIHAVVPNWGLSIVVLTLLFRILIWPLITTQTKSMYGMQRLQPKLQALQKKHKDDREKLTQETMKLYREAGVNPAGGCLPILLQMPLFIILWRIFANFEFNAGFLWIPDLGQPDPFYILPILYVAVILAQSYFMAQGNKQTMRQQMILNVVFVFLFLNFPAGVILYYVVSMLVQVFQYWLIQRQQPQASPAT